MDQKKTGRLIALRRKEKNLTQLQLAQKLNITDRAVSKWETGKAMPDASIMLELCDILQISVNELLNGQLRCEEDSAPDDSQLLLAMAKELEQKNKMIRADMWIIMSVSMLALFTGLFIAAFVVPEGVWQLVVILGCTAVFLAPCFYALKLEVSVGAYKCKNCGHEIVPTYHEVLGAMHRGTTRYLKCPKCGKRSWCKKIWNRN